MKRIVKGQQVYSDVPPQIINGRAVVPIRAVDEVLGADVNWNDNIQSVEIVGSNETDSIEKLKLCSRITNYYYGLQTLGLNLKLTCISLEGVAYAIVWNNNLNKFNKANDSYVVIYKLYSDLLKENENVVSEANKVGIDITDTSNILSIYRKSIDYLGESISSLNSLSFTRQTSDMNNFIDNDNKCFSAAENGISLSNGGYMRFYNLIMNY